MKTRKHICMLMLAAACSCSSGKEMATVNEEPKMAETVEATVRETAEEQTDTQEGIGVNFQEIELEEALKISKEKNKPVFLYCHIKTCGPCKKMKEKVFATTECGNYINSNFIPVTMDMEEGKGVEYGKKYQVGIYPSFLIIDAEGNKSGEIIGAIMDTQKFIERLKEVTNNK